MLVDEDQPSGAIIADLLRESSSKRLLWDEKLSPRSRQRLRVLLRFCFHCSQIPIHHKNFPEMMSRSALFPRFLGDANLLSAFHTWSFVEMLRRERCLDPERSER